MTPDNMHDDSLDPAIRDRLYTGRPAVDALNSTVPQADEARRDALEQRLMARVLEGKAPGKNRPMMHNAALQGAYETPRRFRISTSMLLTATVGMLFATVLVFSSFNRPPTEESPWAVAPVNQDQEAGTPTPSPTPFEATATIIPVEGQVTMPPTVPATGEPSSVTDVPDSGFTATPIPFGSLPVASTYTVQEGDTLVSIAERYYYDVAELIRLNGLRVDADLFVGQQLILPETGMPAGLMTATPVPFVTSTPVPFSVNLYPRVFETYAPGDVAPAEAWLPADAHVSAANLSGLLVAVPAQRLEATSGSPAYEAGAIIDLFTTLALNAEFAPSAAVQRDPINPSDVVVASVPVAFGAQVVSASEETVILYVSFEQGIVLNWLMNDTAARIYYGRAG